MNEKLYNALEEALTGLESGIEIEDLLADNLELEPDLSLLLETAQIARQDVSKEIPPEVYNRSRTRILSRGMQLRQGNRTGSMIFRRSHRLAFALILALVILASGGGLAAGSAKALPGDQLYPVKRAAENIRLNLSIALKDHQAVENRYQARRIDEVKRLIALGRREFVEFHGRVNNQDGDQLDVDGIQVRKDSQTILIGQILPGMQVEVEGVTIPEGWVLASEIHLQIFGFIGYVEKISLDSWQIAGKTVQITAQTRLDSEIQVGDWVIISVLSDDFGNLSALIIDTSYLPTPASELPTPTPTLTIKPGQAEEPGDEIGEAEGNTVHDSADDLEKETNHDGTEGGDQEDDKEDESHSEDDSSEDSHDEADEKEDDD